MTKYVYPARFTPVNGMYAITFPDLPGTHSQGKTLGEAIDMSRDALASWLDYQLSEGETPASPSTPEDIFVKDGEFVSLVDVDLEAYHRLHDNRAVKKTLTIPAWMDAMAEQAGLSCSRVLQDALAEKLGVQR